jgi:hypothetical protein
MTGAASKSEWTNLIESLGIYSQRNVDGDRRHWPGRSRRPRRGERWRMNTIPGRILSGVFRDSFWVEYADRFGVAVAGADAAHGVRGLRRLRYRV